MSLTYIIILGIGLLVLAYFIFQPYYLQRKRNAAMAMHFPQAWDNLLRQQWPLYAKIPDLLKSNLQKRILLFVDEKNFEGCNGFEISETHKILIAAQACLLIINKPFEYFDQLRSILVYPSAFRVFHESRAEDGTVHNQAQINSGEAWNTGKVILSWDDTFYGMQNSEDGHNVVIHEFAHLLDHTNGNANGAPLLEHARNYQQWSTVFSDAFDRLRKSQFSEISQIINPYAATNPGEFFAVISEVFFENSRTLEKLEPQLHDQLVKFYAVDPALW